MYVCGCVCSWVKSFPRRKWDQRPEFKYYMKQFVFHFGKVRNHSLSPQPELKVIGQTGFSTLGKITSLEKVKL